MSKPRTYIITEVAEQYGLTPRTLRWYEESCLLTPDRVGQKRLYSEEDCLKLADIVSWRRQGFTVAEMKQASSKGGLPKETVEAQIQHLRWKLGELDKAIAELMQASQ